ncbi:MAG: porin, partial [Planctomycetota bacterium]
MGLATCLPAVVAGADETGDVDALRSEVASLRAELDALKSQDEKWLTEKRSDEIRALVHDVLADADTRSSLLQDGMTAGWDKKFFLASADGNFRLNIEGQLQVRFVYNHQETASGSSTDGDRWGFENRRTKLKFSGHVVDPSWQYLVQGAFDRDGGEFVLEDVEISKDLGNGWAVRFGQFKGPFMREELTSSKRQLAVERSLVNEAFNQDRTQGVELGYTTDS